MINFVDLMIEMLWLLFDSLQVRRNYSRHYALK